MPLFFSNASKRKANAHNRSQKNKKKYGVDIAKGFAVVGVSRSKANKWGNKFELGKPGKRTWHGYTTGRFLWPEIT
jgi:hypothetical protein